MHDIGKGRKLEAFEYGQLLNRHEIVYSLPSNVLEEATAICTFWRGSKTQAIVICVTQCLEGQDW